MIQRRIEQYSSKEIRFNLMAVVGDRRVKLTQQQSAVEKERNMTVGKLQARGGKVPTPSEMSALVASHPEPLPTGEVAVDERTVDQLTIALAHTTKRSSQIQQELDLENQKVHQWKIENRRRKHNYVPFLVAFLKVCAGVACSLTATIGVIVPVWTLPRIVTVHCMTVTRICGPISICLPVVLFLTGMADPCRAGRALARP